MKALGRLDIVLSGLDAMLEHVASLTLERHTEVMKVP